MPKREGSLIDRSLIAIIIFAVWFIGFAVEVRSETVKFRSNLYFVQFEAIPVGDVEGHVIAVGFRRGLTFFENGEVATNASWITYDLTKGKGLYQGYWMLTYEDGSTTTQKVQGTVEPIPGGRSGIEGTGEYIKGTQRFEGIKGNTSYAGKSFTPYSKEKGTLSDISMDGTATYTLPSK